MCSEGTIEMIFVFVPGLHCTVVRVYGDQIYQLPLVCFVGLPTYQLVPVCVYTYRASTHGSDIGALDHNGLIYYRAHRFGVEVKKCLHAVVCQCQSCSVADATQNADTSLYGMES